MAIEKIKIQGAVLELPAKPVLAIQPIYLKIGTNCPNWQCCLARTSKTAPRILIFSIAMGADYSFYVKSVATCAPIFFGYIIAVLASAFNYLQCNQCLTTVFLFRNCNLYIDLSSQRWKCWNTTHS